MGLWTWKTIAHYASPLIFSPLLDYVWVFAFWSGERVYRLYTTLIYSWSWRQGSIYWPHYTTIFKVHQKYNRNPIYHYMYDTMISYYLQSYNIGFSMFSQKNKNIGISITWIDILYIRGKREFIRSRIMYLLETSWECLFTITNGF